MNNDNYKKQEDLLLALGAIAEAMSFFFVRLKDQGFNDEQAMRFCLCYLKSITRKSGESGDMT